MARNNAAKNGPVENTPVPESEPDALFKVLNAKNVAISIPEPTLEDKEVLQREQRASDEWAAVVLRNQGRIVASGAGVLVCDPTVAPSTKGDDFSIGYARWLHAAIGGQGVFGKTPSWRSLEIALDGLGRADLRLNKKQALRFAKSLGVTHVVVASQQSNVSTPGQQALSFEMFNVVTGEAIGQPIAVSGTQQQQAAKLPSLAREFSRRIGYVAPSTPVALPAEDVQLLGAATYDEQIDKEKIARIQELATRDPLAAILWMEKGKVDPDYVTLWKKQLTTLLGVVPDNALVWRSIYANSARHGEIFRSQFEKLQERWPNNLALLLADTNARTYRGDYAQQFKSAERAVHASPKNEAAWLAFSEAFADKANSVRHGRFQNEMTDAEKARIEELYPHQLSAALQAVKVAPRSSNAWYVVSRAATFNGIPELAFLAMWNSVRLDADNENAYIWGLQISEPKWFDDRDTLLLLAKMIAQKPALQASLCTDLEHSLRQSGLTQEANAVVPATLGQLEIEVKQHPDNVDAWRNLAYINKNNERYLQSAKAFEGWIAAEPNNPIPINNLGNLYERQTQDYARMHIMYERAAKLDPENAVIYYNWGGYYKDVERDFEKAAPLFRKSMELDKKYTLPVTGLANIYWFLKNDKTNGEKYFREAMKRDPENGYVLAEYAWALHRNNQKDKAIAQAKKAQTLGENDHPVFEALGLN